MFNMYGILRSYQWGFAIEPCFSTRPSCKNVEIELQLNKADPLAIMETSNIGFQYWRLKEILKTKRKLYVELYVATIIILEKFLANVITSWDFSLVSSYSVHPKSEACYISIIFCGSDLWAWRESQSLIDHIIFVYEYFEIY